MAGRFVDMRTIHARIAQKDERVRREMNARDQASQPSNQHLALVNLDHTIAASNCTRCAHYDGDGFCSLPLDSSAITGYIQQPERVVCVQWVRREPEAEAS
jgi:hypothetical protein